MKEAYVYMEHCQRLLQQSYDQHGESESMERYFEGLASVRLLPQTSLVHPIFVKQLKWHTNQSSSENRNSNLETEVSIDEEAYNAGYMAMKAQDILANLMSGPVSRTAKDFNIEILATSEHPSTTDGAKSQSEEESSVQKP